MSKALRSYPEDQRMSVATKRVDTNINPLGTVRMAEDKYCYGLGTLSAKALLGSKVAPVVSDDVVLIGSITKVATARAARMMAEALAAEE